VDYIHDSDKKYRTTEQKAPVVVKPQTDTTAATPSPTTFGELMQDLDIVPRQSHMPPVISRPGSSQMQLGLRKCQAGNHMVSLTRDAVSDLSQMEIAKPVQHIC